MAEIGGDGESGGEVLEEIFDCVEARSRRCGGGDGDQARPAKPIRSCGRSLAVG